MIGGRYTDNAGATWRSRRTRDKLNRVLAESPQDYAAIVSAATAGFGATLRLALHRWTSKKAP